MLSKRIFWLTCAAAIASWLIWVRLRQRHDDFAASTPQFAPPRMFVPPPADTASAALPKLDKASVATSPAAPPTAEPTPPSAASVDVAADGAEASDIAETQIEINGYCMRCKTKRPIQNAHRETTESGRPAARGTCPVCGANMFTFLATDDDT
jgi:Domain of unknown function (DUF5679)